jgi:anthranilate phosphoribosyltransferase
MEEVMEEIMTGRVPTETIAAFLVALRAKGETAEELAAAVSVMRGHAVVVHSRYATLLDTCGTGGDMRHTFNVSTTCAFVVSAMGVPVAKHGNRCVSSKTGSADVLEALGVSLSASAGGAQKCLDEIGIAFLFAPNFHPAVRHAMPARKSIQGKTLFNFLGPLSNPAGASHQLIGVSDERWASLMAGALAKLGTTHALVVRGKDGLDEVSTTEETTVFDIKRGIVVEDVVNFAEFGMPKASLADLAGSDAAHNAALLRRVLAGEKGPRRDIVVLNAAMAYYAADKAGTVLRDAVMQGVQLAGKAIDSGAAMEKLEQLKKCSTV